jgi:hypothetical protein
MSRGEGSRVSGITIGLGHTAHGDNTAEDSRSSIECGLVDGANPNSNNLVQNIDDLLAPAHKVPRLNIVAIEN